MVTCCLNVFLVCFLLLYIAGFWRINAYIKWWTIYWDWDTELAPCELFLLADDMQNLCFALVSHAVNMDNFVQVCLQLFELSCLQTNDKHGITSSVVGVKAIWFLLCQSVGSVYLPLAGGRVILCPPHYRLHGLLVVLTGWSDNSWLKWWFCCFVWLWICCATTVQHIEFVVCT